jgi:gas vesicle protein
MTGGDVNRFLIGFAIGAAIGVAVVVLTAPRSGNDLRQNISDTIRGALDNAQAASAAREQELWADFHARLGKESAVTPLKADTRKPMEDNV